MRYYIGRCLLAAFTSDPYQLVGSALHLSPRGRQFEADMGHIRKGCKIKDGVGCRVCCADRLIWITGVTFYSPWTYPSTTQYAPQSTRKPDVGWSGLCRVVSDTHPTHTRHLFHPHVTSIIAESTLTDSHLTAI